MRESCAREAGSGAGFPQLAAAEAAGGRRTTAGGRARQCDSDNGGVSQARRGYQRSAGGLVGAILASLLVIAFVWGLTQLQDREPVDPARTVDYAAVLQEARRQAPFDVLAPTPEPAGWRATSVEWQGAGPENAWSLGGLTEEGEYVGLKQGNATSRDFVAEGTPANQPGDPVAVDGEEWRTLTSGDGEEIALVRAGGDVTTIVTGTASLGYLLEFAGTLRAR